MLASLYKKPKSAVLLFAVTLSTTNLAWADAQDTLNFSVGAAVRFEDNLFRLSDSTNTLAVLGKSQRSDQVYTTNAGIKIDKAYSQQRFQLDATVLDNRYDTYSNLDYTAFNYRAAWLWHLSPYISGTLSADQQQVLNSFADFRQNTKSIQTNQNRVFNVDGWIGGGWHLLGGVSELRSRNSQSFTAVGDYVQTGGEVGVKYVFPSENSIALIQRASKGEFRDRVLNSFAQLDTGFDQTETEAQLKWRLTGKSAIDARLGYVDRQHDHFSSRDFDGATGRLAYNWTPTGKLRINTSVSRSLISYQEDINSYYVADTFSIGPIWQATAKTSLRARYDYSQRDYFGAIVSIPERRKDDVQMFLLAADWKPTRMITVSGALQRETRNSNFNALDYDANSATISAQLLF